MRQANRNEPIVIGGVGGSGTRVIAEILMRSGVYLGNTLNECLDNLWFTVLFKRIDLFKKKQKKRKAEIKRGLDILTGAMIGSAASSDELRNRVRDYTRKIDRDAYLNNEFELLFSSWKNFIDNIVSSEKPDMINYTGWGWKEPNTHIILEYLAKYYSDIRYIYIIRHGLDMACSNNQNQVKLWGAMYGITPSDKNHDPASSFHYWVKANQKAINTGKKMLGDRFLIVNYESLCNSPEKEIKRLGKFLPLSLTNKTFNIVTKIPSPPASIGRYKERDTSWITDGDVRSLNLMGYKY